MTSAWRQLHALGSGLKNTGAVAGRQEAWLMNCLRRNSSSEYGRRHNFDKIDCVAEFRNQIPVISYDDIAPGIQRMYEGEADVLFSAKPVAFERTGGSTSGSKLIPYSQNSLEDLGYTIVGHADRGEDAVKKASGIQERANDFAREKGLLLK